MNSLEQFIASLEYAPHLKDTDMPALEKLDRLCPVLVRCGGCRFNAAVQDAPIIIKALEAAGDYVRDVQFHGDIASRAASWKPEAQPEGSWSLNRPKPAAPYVDAWTREALPDAPAAEMKRARAQHARTVADYWDESQCGGVFDGHGVISDADPGL